MLSAERARCSRTTAPAAQSSRTLVKGTRSGKRGRRATLGDYGPGRSRYQREDIFPAGKRSCGRSHRLRVAESPGTLKGLGTVKVVFSRRESDGNILSLVSSDVPETARGVALACGWRWEIDVATKRLKQRPGPGHYQYRTSREWSTTRTSRSSPTSVFRLRLCTRWAANNSRNQRRSRSLPSPNFSPSSAYPLGRASSRTFDIILRKPIASGGLSSHWRLHDNRQLVPLRQGSTLLKTRRSRFLNQPLDIPTLEDLSCKAQPFG